MTNSTNNDSPFLFGRTVTDLGNGQVRVEIDDEVFYMSDEGRKGVEARYLSHINDMTFLVNTLAEAKDREAGRALLASCMKH